VWVNRVSKPLHSKVQVNNGWVDAVRGSCKSKEFASMCFRTNSRNEELAWILMA